MRKSTNVHMQNGATQKHDGRSKSIGHMHRSIKNLNKKLSSQGTVNKEHRRKVEEAIAMANLRAWENSSATLMAGFDKDCARKNQ